jgi:hypothetical protein
VRGSPTGDGAPAHPGQRLARRARAPPRPTPARQDGGAITAGNSSPLSDGACALVLASAEHARRQGLPALAVVRGYGDANQQPEWFTTAPAAAIPRVRGGGGLKARGEGAAARSIPAGGGASGSAAGAGEPATARPDGPPSLAPEGPSRNCRPPATAGPPAGRRRPQPPPRRRSRARGCLRGTLTIGRSTRWDVFQVCVG